MKSRYTRMTGAFGHTEVVLTPQAARVLTFDVKNCPHCGVHHASVECKVDGERISMVCPTLLRPIVMTAKLFLHPV